MKRFSLFFFLNFFMLVNLGHSFYPRISSLAKGNGNYFPDHSILHINRMISWISEYGLTAMNPYIGHSGLTYPADVPVSLVYTEGLIWGGYCHDGAEPALRVGGQYYKSGTRAGGIIIQGTAQDPDDPAVRVYRVRRDFKALTEEELTREAMIIYNVNQPEVSREMINHIRAQFEKDWNEWPAERGAPFYDLNNNGVYEPGLGETPGLQNADEIIWFVINDLDEDRVMQFSGSPSMGLEIQITFWAYKDRTSNALGNGIFHRYRMINKSGFSIDSLFLAQFSDPDLGDYSNDYAGCDTILNLGFAYNSFSTDREYASLDLPPAAAGYLLLQGPLVHSAGDTAVFNFTPVPDFKNLPLTSFAFWDSFSSDIPLGCYTFAKILYNYLKGYSGTSDLSNPTPFIIGAGPRKGQPTRFPLSGDPISGTGDVDGKEQNPIPGDRRILLSSGPFTLLPGAQQEIIFAVIGGMDRKGTSDLPAHLSALQLVKEYAPVFQQACQQTPVIAEAKSFKSHPDTRHTAIHLKANFYNSDISDCTARFRPVSGGEPVFYIKLYDDGLHEDGPLHDHTWANKLTVENQKHAYNIDLITPSQTINNVLAGQALRPAPVLENWKIIRENGKQDHKIDRYETVCLQFDVSNPDSLHAIDTLLIEDVPKYGPPRPLFRLSLAPGATSQTDSLTYTLQVPNRFRGDSISINLRLRFDGIAQNLSPTFPVTEWLPHASRGTVLDIQSATGWPDNVIPVIADPSALTGHRYEISVDQSVSDSTQFTWELTDLTENKTLLKQQPAGHSADELFPVIHGIEFKVYNQRDFYDFQTVANANGPLNPPEGAVYPSRLGPHPFPGHSLITERQQSDNRRWIISAFTEHVYDYDEFLNATTQDGALWKRILAYDYEIRFTGGGNMGTDSTSVLYDIPFELWNIGINTPDDPGDDFRMIPLITDINGNEIFDNRIGCQTCTELFSWLLPQDITPGETGYQTAVSQIQSGTFQVDTYEAVFSNMQFTELSCNINDPSQPTMPEQGTVFRILTRKPLQDGDRFVLQAPKAQADNIYGRALTFTLDQNYPNPFNSQTTIRFESSLNSEVEIEIFDLLGRRIRHFTRNLKGRIPQTLIWDGTNEQGEPAGSGIYFYRLRNAHFSKSLKMILLR